MPRPASAPRGGSAVLAALLAAVCLAVLTGCSGSGSSGASSGASSSPSAGASGFPVVLDNAFGSTTVPERPKRVVTLGWSAQDVVYALGVTPVGMPEYTFGGDDRGVLPWLSDRYDPERTTLLDTTDGPPLERIAALRPDVILTPYNGFEESVYDQLSAIAPTVAYPDAAWSTPWQEQTRIIGKALGRSAQAEALLTRVDGSLAAAAQAHPELSGLTFAFANFTASEMDVYLPSDPRVQLVQSLGMTVAPSVQALDDKTPAGEFYAAVSPENAPQVTSDVLVGIMGFSDQTGTAGVTGSPVYSLVPAVRDGSAALVDDDGFVMAVSAVSVLSIPWSLDRLVPQLATAAQAARAARAG